MLKQKTMDAYAAIAPGKIGKITLPIPEPDDYKVLIRNEGCVFCNTTGNTTPPGAVLPSMALQSTCGPINRSAPAKSSKDL